VQQETVSGVNGKPDIIGITRNYLPITLFAFFPPLEGKQALSLEIKKGVILSV